MLRVSLASALIVSFTFFGMEAGSAQTPAEPKSPAEIAAASQLMAEKYAACRRQAKEQKVSLLKQHGFIRHCMKNAQ